LANGLSPAISAAEQGARLSLSREGDSQLFESSKQNREYMHRLFHERNHSNTTTSGPKSTMIGG